MHRKAELDERLSIQEYLIQRFPHLNGKWLTGVDSGTKKKAYVEDINETLQATNVFILTPVIESCVDITIPIQKDIRRIF